MDESQAEIKIAGRNINNVIYADYTTLMLEVEEKLKSLWMRVKEESENAGLKLNIQKMKIMASSSITSWQIDGETMEKSKDFILGGFKITAGILSPPLAFFVVMLPNTHLTSHSRMSGSR